MPAATIEDAPKAHTPETPLTEANKKAAAKAKGKATKKAPAKPKAEDKPKKKRPQYPEDVTAVAKATRAALPEGARSPGAAQVARVMDVVGGRKVADVAGISLAKLTKWAKDGERPEDYRNMHDLTKEVEDPWVTSRRLAMVLVGIEDHRKATAS